MSARFLGIIALLLICPVKPSEQADQYDAHMAQGMYDYLTAPWKNSTQDWYTAQRAELRHKYPARNESVSDYREYRQEKSYLQAQRDTARDANTRQKILGHVRAALGPNR